MRARTVTLAVELVPDGMRVVGVDRGLTTIAHDLEAVGARPVAHEAPW